MKRLVTGLQIKSTHCSYAWEKQTRPLTEYISLTCTAPAAWRYDSTWRKEESKPKIWTQILTTESLNLYKTEFLLRKTMSLGKVSSVERANKEVDSKVLLRCKKWTRRELIDPGFVTSESQRLHTKVKWIQHLIKSVNRRSKIS